MNLIPENTAPAAEQSLARIQALVDAGLRHAAAAIAEFNRGYDEFWSGTDEEVIARATLMGPAAVALMFARNTALGELLNATLGERNAALAAAGRPPLTAQAMRVTAARDLQFVDGGFVIIREEEPEEEP